MLARHRSFALVLAGGGARGVAHTGVLRALEHAGYAPSGIVGVSMGAIVGATYALNANWYADLVGLDVDGIPGLTTRDTRSSMRARAKSVLDGGRALRHLMLRWGALAPSETPIRAKLEELTLGKDLEDGRIPVVAVATDLTTGKRVVIDHGSAAEATYASAALAGILPPARRNGTLLADGAYADIAPIDVARAMGAEVVIAVNASPRMTSAAPRTAVQALLRAMEISHHQHADERYQQADLVLTPAFSQPVTTLDFRYHRRCIALGAVAVRCRRSDLARLLAPDTRRSGDRRRTPDRRGMLTIPTD